MSTTVHRRRKAESQTFYNIQTNLCDRPNLRFTFPFGTERIMKGVGNHSEANCSLVKSGMYTTNSFIFLGIRRNLVIQIHSKELAKVWTNVVNLSDNQKFVAAQKVVLSVLSKVKPMQNRRYAPSI
eukprot:TRINITY_DN456_c0_g1_i1.p4 TRINITY_DN456_c0_g1~~TRINITY_DN456_c0_g1_i1.p4  ORF type:complete len:126 (-),score=1.89 TRINITY_DN456_c0_g1_i1:444-821(-)